MTRKYLSNPITQICSLIVLILSLIVLLSWKLGLTVVPQFIEGFPAMIPNTAVMFSFLSLSTLLLVNSDTSDIRKKASIICGLVVLSLSVSGLFEDISDVRLGVNHILPDYFISFPLPETQSVLPARGTLIAFLLAAFSIFAVSNFLVLSQVVAIMLYTIIFVALAGQAFHFIDIKQQIPALLIRGMAIPTTLSFLFSATAILMLRPGQGLLKYLDKKTPSGVVLRRYIFGMLLVPVLFGIAGYFGAGKDRHDLLLILSLTGLILLTVVTIITLASFNELQYLEEESQAKEKSLREIQEVAKLGSWQWDIKSNKIYFSNEINKIFGVNFSDYVSTYDIFLSTIHPEDRQKVEEAVVEAMTGKPFIIDHRIKRPDGEIVYVHQKGIVHFDRHSRPEKFIGTVHDVSEIKKAQLAALESERQLQQFFDNTGDAIITADHEGKITFANNEALKIFKYKKDELLGKEIETLVPERFRQKHRSQRTTYMMKPKSRPMGMGLKLYGVNKFGREIPLEISLTPTNVNGKTYVTSLIRDVTQRNKHEEQLRFLNSAGKVFSESIDYQTTIEKILTLGVPYLGDWCVIYALDDKMEPFVAGVKHVDSSQEQLLHSILESEEYRNFSAQALIGSIKDGHSLLVTSIDDQALLRLQELKLRSFIIVPLRLRKKVIGAITFSCGPSFRNYTNEDKTLIENFAQRAAFAMDNARLYHDAIKASQEKEEVMSMVSHDLKNPLNAVLLSAKMLERALTKMPDSEKLTRFTGSIMTGAQLMKSLILNILDIGRIREGKFALNIQKCTVKDLIAPIKDLFTPLAKDKNIDIHFITDIGDHEIECDPDRVSQIFSNLIGNALKFTPAGGHINIRVSLDDHILNLSVEDDGQGIQKTELEKIFVKHWQSDDLIHQGSGLGLYITNKIVKAHGGMIWAESEPMKGSIFHVKIPERPDNSVNLH